MKMNTLKTVLGLAMVSIIAFSFYFGFRNPFSKDEKPGFDGRLRLNEVEVLRMGINPFDILSGKVYPPEGYISGNLVVNEKWDTMPHGNKEVHTYTPWGYSLALPFTVLPREVAGWIFWVIDTMALLGIVAFAFAVGFGLRHRWLDGLFVAAAAICLGNPYPINSSLNNYSTLLVAAALSMCWCLNNKRDVLAGFCWALMMVKPHFGILFAVPILLEWRWKTVVTAVLTCAFLSVPPAIMCRTPPWEMVMNVVDKKGAGFAFQWTGFFPAPVFSFLSRFVDGSCVSALSMALGVALMAAMLWKIRKDGVPQGAFGGFFIFCVPVALTVPMWLYSQFQDATILTFFQIALACAILHAREVRTKALLAAVLLLNASRVLIEIRGLVWGSPLDPVCNAAYHVVKIVAYVASFAVVMRGVFGMARMRDGATPNGIPALFGKL